MCMHQPSRSNLLALLDDMTWFSTIFHNMHGHRWAILLIMTAFQHHSDDISSLRLPSFLNILDRSLVAAILPVQSRPTPALVLILSWSTGLRISWRRFQPELSGLFCLLTTSDAPTPTFNNQPSTFILSPWALVPIHLCHASPSMLPSIQHRPANGNAGPVSSPIPIPERRAIPLSIYSENPRNGLESSADICSSL
ncbi:hypothetical protein D9619_008422 [Psilocybe cf. subviscida]|uniref:Uncharacterized protein n=1 Tax=Psilocybe cf. subviscida TaxID=2480587 RepID=A0A8H5B9S5_9AGAR|nr:hypothetical protein D9619_008422 [Psilocybe cf. subviscida]